jgi:hypothetical protein
LLQNVANSEKKQKRQNLHPISLPIYLSIYLATSIHLSMQPSIDLLIFVPIDLSTYPPTTYPSIRPSIHPSDHLTYLFVPKPFFPADRNVTSVEDQKRQVRKLARPESSSKQGARNMDTPLFVSCRQKKTYTQATRPNDIGTAT